MKLSDFRAPPPEGRWFDYMPTWADQDAEPSRFLIARIGAVHLNRSIHRVLAPHIEKLRSGTIDRDAQDDIELWILAEHVWLDAEGVEDDKGNPVTLDAEARFKILADPGSYDVYSFVMRKAAELEEEHQANMKEARGNSRGSSSTTSDGESSRGTSSSGGRNGRAEGSRSREGARTRRRSTKT